MRQIGSWVMIEQTNRKTEITTLYRYIRFLFLQLCDSKHLNISKFSFFKSIKKNTFYNIKIKDDDLLLFRKWSKWYLPVLHAFRELALLYRREWGWTAPYPSTAGTWSILSRTRSCLPLRCKLLQNKSGFKTAKLYLPLKYFFKANWKKFFYKLLLTRKLQIQ